MGRVPSRGSEQFIVRFPDGLRDRIKSAAAENGRSMNAEIIATLEEKYPAHPPYAEWLNVLAEIFRRRAAGELDDRYLRDLPSVFGNFVQHVEKELSRPPQPMARRDRRAWVEGQDACKAGCTLADNPYEEDDRRADVWAEGFRNPDLDPFL